MTEETTGRICPRCGKAIPAANVDCPRCDHRLKTFLRSRETVLMGSAVIVVILFFVTNAVVRTYHKKLHALAGQWFAQAESDLNSGNPATAVGDLRNALVYEPEDPRIQFRLTQALMAEGRNEEARSYLEGLLARSPTDAEVNLSLARIAAREGSETAALRYYHGAIYGVWPKNPEANRLNTRFELCRFLVAQNDDAVADGELLALELDIPRTNAAAIHEETGKLFLQVGDARRALKEFQAALRGPHAPQSAWRGAGLAAYKLEYFGMAEHYLERAQRIQMNDPDVASELEISRLVEAWNPYRGGLTAAERRERARHDFAQALQRLRACAKSRGLQLSAGTGRAPQSTVSMKAGQKTSSEQGGKALENPKTKPSTRDQAGKGAQSAPEEASTEQADLNTLYSEALSLHARLTERNLIRHPDQIDAAMSFAFSVEQVTAEKCGEPPGLDKALLEMSKLQQGAE